MNLTAREWLLAIVGGVLYAAAFFGVVWSLGLLMLALPVGAAQ